MKVVVAPSSIIYEINWLIIFYKINIGITGKYKTVLKLKGQS